MMHCTYHKNVTEKCAACTDGFGTDGLNLHCGTAEKLGCDMERIRKECPHAETDETPVLLDDVLAQLEKHFPYRRTKTECVDIENRFLFLHTSCIDEKTGTAGAFQVKLLTVDFLKQRCLFLYPQGIYADEELMPDKEMLRQFRYAKDRFAYRMRAPENIDIGTDLISGAQALCEKKILDILDHIKTQTEIGMTSDLTEKAAEKLQTLLHIKNILQK